jgi:O-antigen/teichoic acid export membrane protein
MSLVKKAVHGMGWVFLFSMATRGGRFLTTLILARLLDPADFGLVAIGILVINTLGMFRDMGLGAALIFQKKDIEKAANTSLILFPIIGLVLFATSYILAPFSAAFFNNDESESVIRYLSVTLLLVCTGLTPSILLDRELNFKRQTFPEVGSIVVYAAIAIPLAYGGFGVWSIVWGKIISEVAWVAITWAVSPWKLSLEFDWAIAKEMLKYGRHIMGVTMISFLLSNVDNGFVGKLLGATSLGFYTIAFNVSNLPALNITQLVNRVMFPTYSKLQEQKETLVRVYMKSIKYVSALSAPISLGMMVVAPELVTVFLGEKWAPAVSTLQILCIAGLFRSIRASMGPLLAALGRPDLLAKYSLYELVMMCVLLYPFSINYGIFGAGLAVTISVVIFTVIGYVVTDNLLKIGWKQFLDSILASFVSSALMVAAMIIFGLLIPTTGISKLIILSSFGGISYLLAVYFLYPGLFKEFISVLRHAKS